MSKRLIPMVDGGTFAARGYLDLSSWERITEGLELTPEQFSQLYDCFGPGHEPRYAGPDEFWVPVRVKIVRDDADE